MSELDVSRLFSVKGKFVLVTGGGRGIGKMIAEGFAANGATVFLTSRDEKACSLTASEISASSGGKVIVRVCLFVCLFFFFFANQKKIYCLIIAIGEPSRRSLFYFLFFQGTAQLRFGVL